MMNKMAINGNMAEAWTYLDKIRSQAAGRVACGNWNVQLQSTWRKDEYILIDIVSWHTYALEFVYRLSVGMSRLRLIEKNWNKTNTFASSPCELKWSPTLRLHADTTKLTTRKHIPPAVPPYLVCISVVEQETRASSILPGSETGRHWPAYLPPEKQRKRSSESMAKKKRKWQIPRLWTQHAKHFFFDFGFKDRGRCQQLTCLKKLFTVKVTGLKFDRGPVMASWLSELAHPERPGANTRPVWRLSCCRRSITDLTTLRASSFREVAVSRRWSNTELDAWTPLETMSWMCMAVHAKGMRNLPRRSQACWAAIFTFSRFCSEKKKKKRKKEKSHPWHHVQVNLLL